MKHLCILTGIMLFLFTVGAIEVKALGCLGGSQIGATVTPTSAWQTANIVSGQYVSFNATAGSYYTFTFCSGGAVAPAFNSELSLFTLGPNVLYAYNNDYCGVNPQITWFCQTSGVYDVLLLQNYCSAGSDFSTYKIAFKIAVPLNDDICAATYLYSNRCSLSYTTYNNSYSTTSSQAAPTCGSFSGRDIWFSTKVPSSGKLNIVTQAGSITTNAAIAAYTGTSCSSTLTQVGCNLGSMPQLNLTGLNPGDSIYIRFFTKNNTTAGTFGIGLQDPSPNWCMLGNAAEINSGSNCVNLTPNKTSQEGAMWGTTQINLNNAFDYTYYVNLGSNAGGGDGIAFVLQNNAAGLSALGQAGYQLGIGPLTNTLITEFDTYDNGAADGDGVGFDHIAIDTNGVFSAPAVSPVQAGASASIKDGAYHAVRLTWNPTTTVYSVYFDGVLKVTYTKNIISKFFGGNPMVYWGFTSSTGSAYNAQSICPGSLPGAPAGNVLPVNLSDLNASVINQQVNLTWTTYSELNNKEFIVERSNDGNDFSSIGIVQAYGNSNQNINYQFVDKNAMDGVSYYRIKQIDNNGEYRYSAIKDVELNSSSDIYHIYPNPSSSSVINIEIMEDATIEIYDMSNVLQYQQAVKNGNNTVNLKDGQLNAGVYYALIHTTNNVYFSKIILSF